MRCAWEDGIKSLYHYEVFYPERLRDVLANHRIWLSSPAAFNDPWDFRMDFNVQDLSDPRTMKKEVRGLLNVARSELADFSRKDRRGSVARLRRSSKALAMTAMEVAVKLEKQLAEQFRVYCTGVRQDCQLMWAHYAQKHNGICLEFTTQTPIFGGAVPAQYFEDYPKYPLFSSEDMDPRHKQLPLVAKSSAWKYETEYRVIAREHPYFIEGIPLVTTGNYLPIPPNALTSIIVGCLAPDSTVEAIRTMLSETKHAAALKRAQRAKGRYELDISTLA